MSFIITLNEPGQFVKRFPLVLLCILLLLNTFPVLSQEIEYYDGKIINSSTGDPVPFTTIKLKKNELGVYANANGDFKIIHNPDFKDDSLQITCIGYRGQTIPYNNLKSGEINKIYLDQSTYGLNEVKIVANRKIPGPLRIIERAIRRIKDNYPFMPFSYIAYYRDYQKENGNYLNLNEAIIQSLDKGFGVGSLSNQYRMLDFRMNKDFPRINITPYYHLDNSEITSKNEKFIPMASLGDQNGNELFILMVHDAIRNWDQLSFSFVNCFSEDFILNHSFSDPIRVYNNDLLLYRINFEGKQKVIGKDLMVSGAIYIQPEDYSIHKLEYSCFYNNDDNIKKRMFNVEIEYGYENTTNSLMYLKYISFNNIFNLVDTTDNSYFRVMKSYWNPSEYSKATLVVEFNKKIDPESIKGRAKFDIRIRNKPKKIKSIQASGYKLLIRLSDKKINKLTHKCTVGIRNIKAVDGSILNQRRTLELYQYRELFVQEYNKSIPLQDSCYLQYLPLDKNCISKYSGKDKYWMNSPENIK